MRRAILLGVAGLAVGYGAGRLIVGLDDDTPTPPPSRPDIAFVVWKHGGEKRARCGSPGFYVDADHACSVDTTWVIATDAESLWGYHYPSSGYAEYTAPRLVAMCPGGPRCARLGRYVAVTLSPSTVGAMWFCAGAGGATPTGSMDGDHITYNGFDHPGIVRCKYVTVSL